MQTFKDLDVWNKSMQLAGDVYRITQSFPKEELYGLSSQMRRAAVSVPSNIAEGSKRGKKDFAHFIRIAQGSNAELETQFLIANDLKYLKEGDLHLCLQKLEDNARMLSKLHQSLLLQN